MALLTARLWKALLHTAHLWNPLLHSEYVSIYFPAINLFKSEGIIAERMNTQYADTYFPAVSRYSLYMTSAIRWRIRNTITLVFAVDVRLRLLRRASCN